MKIKQTLLMCGVAFMIAACDNTPTKGSSTEGWKIICVEGYEYVKGGGGNRGYMAPKFNKEGKPSSCDLGTYQNK